MAVTPDSFRRNSRMLAVLMVSTALLALVFLMIVVF